MAKRAQAKSAAVSRADTSEQTVLSIKMTKRFRDWMAGLADTERITTVQLVEKAVVEFAENRKYAPVAPKRTEGR